MARKKYSMTEARIRRFIKEGRGKGAGPNYKPWHMVSDVPSLGRVHRPYGIKAGRQHHLLSDNEYYAFLLFEWNDNVIDIREQFPLIDRRETVEIAARCGVKHPIDQFSSALWVLTTDFLLTVRTPGGPQLIARTVKQAEDLNNERTRERTLEKLEIERRYWEKRNISWKIVTDMQVKTQYTRNLEWIFDKDARIDNIRESEIDDCVCRELAKIKQIESLIPIKLACSRIDKQKGYMVGQSLAALRRLLWGKIIRVDLQVQRIPDLPVCLFEIVKGAKNEDQ